MASSRSACSIGDRTPCTRVARHVARTAVHRGELRVGQLRRAERSRRLLGVLQPILEQRGAALDRGGRVVQLVRQPRGQLAEGDHLLVVQIARREDARAIEHGVDEDRRDLVALADHLAEVVPVNGQDRRRLLGDACRPAG